MSVAGPFSFIPVEGMFLYITSHIKLKKKPHILAFNSLSALYISGMEVIEALVTVVCEHGHLVLEF